MGRAVFVRVMEADGAHAVDGIERVLEVLHAGFDARVGIGQPASGCGFGGVAFHLENVGRGGAAQADLAISRDAQALGSGSGKGDDIRGRTKKARVGAGGKREAGGGGSPGIHEQPGS